MLGEVYYQKYHKFCISSWFCTCTNPVVQPNKLLTFIGSFLTWNGKYVYLTICDDRRKLTRKSQFEILNTSVIVCRNYRRCGSYNKEGLPRLQPERNTVNQQAPPVLNNTLCDCFMYSAWTFIVYVARKSLQHHCMK